MFSQAGVSVDSISMIWQNHVLQKEAIQANAFLAVAMKDVCCPSCS